MFGFRIHTLCELCSSSGTGTGLGCISVGLQFVRWFKTDAESDPKTTSALPSEKKARHQQQDCIFRTACLSVYHPRFLSLCLNIKTVVASVAPRKKLNRNIFDLCIYPIKDGPNPRWTTTMIWYISSCRAALLHNMHIFLIFLNPFAFVPFFNKQHLKSIHLRTSWLPCFFFFAIDICLRHFFC